MPNLFLTCWLTSSRGTAPPALTASHGFAREVHVDETANRSIPSKLAFDLGAGVRGAPSGFDLDAKRGLNRHDDV